MHAVLLDDGNTGGSMGTSPYSWVNTMLLGSNACSDINPRKNSSFYATMK
jgi:hypothetical protein